MELSRRLQIPRISKRLQQRFRQRPGRPDARLGVAADELRTDKHTSIEQKIQSVSVCSTTSADPPTPNAKYTPRYLPTWGLLPTRSLV